MNKKVIGGLIGGGMTIGLISYAGVKTGEKIHYDNQVKYFGGLRGEFKDFLSEKSDLKDSTIPRWEDLGIWKTHFYNNNGDNQKIQDGPDKVRKINSPEELRDECYKFIIQKGDPYKECNWYAGWCTTCLFLKGWYNTDAKTY